MSDLLQIYRYVTSYILKNKACLTTSTMLQVQMFTEDWADHSTVTGGMSDLGTGPAPQHQQQAGAGGWRPWLGRWAGPVVIALLSLLAILSPVLMLILPHADFMNMRWLHIAMIVSITLSGCRYSQLKCEVDCDGLLISFSFKLLVLALGSWAVFYRAPRATLPRIHLFR